MKKGFTLVELMSVIAIISLIAILTFPPVVSRIKSARGSNENTAKSTIITSFKNYLADNASNYDNDEDVCLAINTLINNDYVKEDIVKFDDVDLSNKSVLYSVSDNSYNIVDECEGD